MRKSIDRILQVSTAALVLSGILALWSAPTVGGGIFAIGLVQLFAWTVGEPLDRRHGWYRYLTNGVTALFAATLPFWVKSLGLLPAVIALIMFIQTHKLAHRKERKDYYQLYLMCFLLLVAACGLGPDPAIGAAMLCFLISAVWALLALQIRTEANQVGPSGMADVIPLSEHEPNAVSSRTGLLDWGLMRAVGMVCFAAALLTAGIFLGMPRMEAGILGRSNILASAETETATGLSDTVEVGLGGRIRIDRSPVMRVEFPEAPDGRYDGELYWQSGTMDSFTTRIWDRLGGPYAIEDSRQRSVPIRTGKSSEVAREPAGDGRLVRQRIFLEEVTRTGLPCLASPLRVTSDGSSISWNPLEDGYFVQVDRLKSGSISYDVVSEVVTHSPEQLRSARTDYEGSMSGQDYFLLTRHNLQERTVRLVQELTEQYETPYDKARALEAWLSSTAFVYTLDEPVLPRYSPIDAFLLEARRGHCQLYASALALMLRTLGIPTRVVAGYRGGEWNESDKAYVISRDMAHLWVEVYFLDYGWVTFDPSPHYDAGDVSMFGQVSESLSRSQWRLRIFWYRNIIGYDGGFTLERLRDWGEGLFVWTVSPYTGYQEGNPESGRRGGKLAALALPVLLACLAAGGLYLRFRRRRGQEGLTLTEAQRRARILLDRVSRQLRRQGINCEQRTAGELALAARGKPNVRAEHVTEALRTYDEVRFGQRPLDRSRLKALCRQLRATRPAP